jgi:hypothetical protein
MYSIYTYRGGKTNLCNLPQIVLELVCTQVTKCTSKALCIVHDVQQLVSKEGEDVVSPLNQEIVEILLEENPC